MSLELRRNVDAKYRQLLHTINYPSVFPLVYRGKRIILEDCDNSQNPIGNSCLSENYYLRALKNHNKKIDFPKVEDYWYRIKIDPLHAELYARGIFQELWRGELALEQDIDAGLEAAMMTIPSRNITEANIFLAGQGYLPIELSAGSSNSVNSFLSTKILKSKSSNLASKFIYGEDGLFTKEVIFYYGENRTAGMKEIMIREGVDPNQCSVVDDSLPFMHMIEALVDGVYICLSDDENVRKFEENNVKRSYGPLFIVRPEIREDYYLLVRTLVEYEKIDQIGSVLPPPELSNALHKIDLLRSQGKHLLRSSDIMFAMDVNDFANRLTELSIARELAQSTKKLNLDTKIRKLRSPWNFKDKRDVVDSLVQELDENLREQGIRDEFVRRIDELAYEWQTLTNTLTAS